MPNLLLVTIVSVALLRGSIFGAAGGFFGGLLVDTANLETLGLTSLVLTVGGYWIGRYGETTGRDRTHAPFVSVAVVTVLYAVGVLVLHFLLGDPVSARRILVEALVPTIALEPDPHGARLLARDEAAAAARLARARGGGAAPWLARRAAAGRSCRRRPASRSRYRLTPQMALRVAVLGGVVLLIFATLFLRLWALQVLSGTHYLRVARSNQLRTIRLEAPRGPILDRNGRVLVENRGGTAVALWPADLPDKWYLRLRELKRLSKVVHVPVKEMLAGIAARKGDPLTPVIVKEPVGERQIIYLKEHQDEFPRAARSRTRSCATTRTAGSRRSSSATSPRSRSRS